MGFYLIGPLVTLIPLGSISFWAFKPYCDDGLLGISPTNYWIIRLRSFYIPTQSKFLTALKLKSPSMVKTVVAAEEPVARAEHRLWKIWWKKPAAGFRIEQPDKPILLFNYFSEHRKQIHFTTQITQVRSQNTNFSTVSLYARKRHLRDNSKIKSVDVVLDW